MKNNAIAILLLASVVTVFAQCNTHTQTCVQNRVRLLIPFIEARVRSITFDDIRFDVVFIDITFSNIRVSQFDIGTASARDTGSSIILTLSGISLRVDTDWRRRRLFRTRRGNIVATASNSIVTVSYRKSSTCPSASGISCSMTLNNSDVDINGRRFGVIPRRRAPGEFRRIIRQEFCDLARQQIAGLISRLSC